MCNSPALGAWITIKKIKTIRVLPKFLHCFFYHRTHCCISQWWWIRPKKTSKKLTTPFWTENPNWYFVSGLFILTSTTGAQDTAVNFTAVLFLVFWKLHKKIHYYIQNYLDLIQCHLHYRKYYSGKIWTQKQCQIYWQDFWTFFQVSTQCLTTLQEEII